jgi:hypothetical protein
VVGLRSRREEEEEETLTKVPGVERGSDAVGELGRSPASEIGRRLALSRTLTATS